MKKKGLWIPLGIIVALALVYILGPTMPQPELNNNIPDSPKSTILAEQMILAGEAGISNIRPGNGSQLLWFNDSLKSKTDFCLLYLHGFSASPREGDPVYKNLGRMFGMNVYVPRMAEHGLDTPDALLNMTPDILWESAKDALSKAKALGDNVIVMGTSTGGTLAIKLAAEFPDLVHSLILCSPNVRLYDKTSVLLDRPWGSNIVRLVMGGDQRVLEPDPETDDYWYNQYRVESIVYLQQLIRATMKDNVFEKVTQPVFTGCYFKDEENQDDVVSVDAIYWMFDNLGTSTDEKELVAFPDAGAHVICCDLTSNSWNEVQAAIANFIETTVVNK